MPPSVCPRAVIEGVADLVVGNGDTVVSRQQIAPRAVAVGIRHIVLHRAKRAGGIVVTAELDNIARVVVRPSVGKAPGLIVLPDQLVGRVIDIGGVGIPEEAFLRDTQ